MANDEVKNRDIRLLGILDLADSRGTKLSLQSVAKLMKDGYTLEDLIKWDEEVVGGIRANVKETLHGLLIDVEEDCSTMGEGKSLYRLVLVDGGVSENTVRNLLHPSGIRYDHLSTIDYETFRRLTGGGERKAIFIKIMKAFENDGGIRDETYDTGIIQTKKLGKRLVNQIEKDLTIVYDEMPDQSIPGDWMKKTGLQEHEVAAGLERLAQNGLVHFNEEQVSKRTRHLEEVISSIPEISRRMVEQRMTGRTLQEIGDINNVTRERIRQILEKVISSIPLTHITEARRMRYLFESYDLDPVFFETVLGERKEVYHFLSEKCTKGTSAKREIYSFLQSEQRQRMLVSEGLYEDVSGNASPLSKMGLVEKYFFLEGRETKHANEHHRRYLSFIEEELRNQEEVLQHYMISERAFEGIADRIEGCLQSSKRRIRYFDVKPILEEANTFQELFRLDPGIYNMRIIYERHAHYFFALDIRDYFELHNIVKDNLRIETVQTRRMPEFSIGVTNKLDWLVGLIDEWGPISLDEFVSILEERFGLLASSSRSLIQMELSVYLTPHNELVHDITELSIEEESFIKSILVDDIYTVPELINRHSDVKNFRQLYLNNRNLGTVGYDLRGGFVIRKGFGSAERYFRHFLLTKDYFRTDNSSAVQNTQSFWRVLVNLQQNLDLFRVDDETYMNISVLERAGVSKKEILDFREKVFVHFSDGRFFSVENIQEELNQAILGLGFDGIFYESICRYDKRIRFIQFATSLILYCSKEKKRQVDFIECIVQDGMDINVLQSDIHRRYGIEIALSKLIEKIRASDMYYVQELERVFSNRQSFLDMVYGREE
ncbi:sigma factor-like helix-turn-helix DNA-binding protein [Exiguobacterium sp. s193]|uniref:sigma factor-like helix-turn-helix DNA-binding protein n=1 Tax=Exiguobacterium sp. s193 TaxID=2751207 RepID=UPI001BE9EDA9